MIMAGAYRWGAKTDVRDAGRAYGWPVTGDDMDEEVGTR